MLDHRLAEALRRCTIQERHLGAVLLLQEAVQGREHHGGGDLIGIDEIQRLAHRQEHFIVHPFGDVVDPQPLGPGVFVALLDIPLTPEHGGDQSQAEADLLRPGEHVVVAQNRGHTIHRCRQIGEIKAAVGAWFVLLVEDHRMALPLQPVFDVQLFEQLQHVRVGPEEDVQAGFVPVAVLVFPGRHLAAENIPGFHNDGGVAGIRQVFGTGESSKTSSGNSDAHAAVSKVKPTLKGLDPRSLLKVVSAFPWARLG